MIEIRNLIHDLGETHTVILSSHILSEVQTICDRVLIIAHGKVAAQGTPEELAAQLAARGMIAATALGTQRTDSGCCRQGGGPGRPARDRRKGR